MILMLGGLSPKAYILFIHITTEVEVCLVTEKMKSKKSVMIFNLLIDVLPKGMSQSYLHQCEVVKSVPYVETGEDPSAYMHS